jgi:hypothetical protein
MRKSCEHRLSQYLQSRTPPVHFSFDNTKANKPAGKPYVEMTIIEGKSRRANLGGKRTVRHVGVLQIDVLYPKDTGMGSVEELATACSKLFDEWSTILDDNARLNFKTPVLKDLGSKYEFVRIAVSIPYWRDENSE